MTKFSQIATKEQMFEVLAQLNNNYQQERFIQRLNATTEESRHKWWGKANCLFIFLTIVFREIFSEAFLLLLGITRKGENTPLPEGIKKILVDYTARVTKKNEEDVGKKCAATKKNLKKNNS